MKRNLVIIGILIILFTSTKQPTVSEGKDIPRVGGIQVHYESII